jgi:hypothetical protein
MDPLTKDYITVALSMTALLLSIYNFFRSRSDIRKTAVLTISGKRSECEAIAWDAITVHRQNETSLRALIFDARREQVIRADDDPHLGHFAKVVKYAESLLESQTASIKNISELLAEGRRDVTVDGSHDELVAVGKVHSDLVSMKKRAVDEGAKIEGDVAEFRRYLIAASLRKD